jgi:hypothetical protein
MTHDRLQSRADELAARVEALAAALQASGVPEETSTRLLSQAAAAVLQALTIEAFLEERRPVVPTPRRTANPETRLELDLRLAA